MARNMALRSALTLSVIVSLASMSQAQTIFTQLFSFNVNEGAHPTSIVQGFNGNFYGITSEGGTHHYGSLFEMTPGGAVKVLYDFCSKGNCTDGGGGGFLLLGSEGDIYGATSEGGNIQNCPYVSYGCGTVFKVTPAGVMTTLHRFCSAKNCADGWAATGLVQAADGSLYGTTFGGGANGSGTIFQITNEGKFITLNNFCSQFNCADGYSGTGIIQGANGNFYGTTNGGGDNNVGAIFRISPAGGFEVLASLDGSNGAQPKGGLVQAANGNLYGTAWVGGTVGIGTVFEVTPAGALTLVYNFCSDNSGNICRDGEFPLEPLVLASDGSLCGTTPYGGNANESDGVAFEITPSGAESTLHDFCSVPPLCSDGTVPAGLTQSTDGLFYGTTQFGGTMGFGTIFTLDAGLPPFVKSLPFLGKAGTSVTILGSNLTGATSVTFSGTAATFKVISPSEIATTVPVAATTGKISVTTPQGSLVTNVNFNVIP